MSVVDRDTVKPGDTVMIRRRGQPRIIGRVESRHAKSIRLRLDGGETTLVPWGEIRKMQTR